MGGFVLNGGTGGIRTLDRLLTYTRFPIVRLQPLGHRSINLKSATFQGAAPENRGRTLPSYFPFFKIGYAHEIKD